MKAETTRVGSRICSNAIGMSHTHILVPTQADTSPKRLNALANYPPEGSELILPATAGPLLSTIVPASSIQGMFDVAFTGNSDCQDTSEEWCKQETLNYRRVKERLPLSEAYKYKVSYSSCKLTPLIF